jgi:hypothetical protein
MTAGKALRLGLGFVGSMVISQGSIDWGIVLALATGVAFAFYLIASRQAERVSAPGKTLAFQCLVGAALAPQAASPSSLRALICRCLRLSRPSDRRLPTGACLDLGAPGLLGTDRRQPHRLLRVPGTSGPA